MTTDNWLASLEESTIEQLKEWRHAIDSEVQKREAKDRLEASRKIRELAEVHGIDLATLTRGTATKKHAARYRDPNNQFNTWSGIGRKPKWVTECLANGKTMADLEVK